MANWDYKVKLKHLFTENEDWDSVQESMNKVADVIDKESCFAGFPTKQFRNIPQEDDFFTPIEYANKLLDRMYRFADFHRIWID